MDQKELTKAIKDAKEKSKKRKFKQGFDLIINLRNLDLKKPDQQVDLYVLLKHIPRKRKVCALVGPELKEEAQKVCDMAVTVDEFPKYTEKKHAKKLADEFDYFIAQANIMPQIAKVFGRTFGVRGKMPNPKAGCVVPPKANLGPLYDKLQRTVRVQAKSVPMIQCGLGKEDMSDEDIVHNALAIYNAVLHKLPNEKNNVKQVRIKLTMGKPIIIKH